MSIDAMITDDAWWVDIRKYKPDIGEDVIIISKIGHTTRQRYTDFGYMKNPLFEPDGMEPGKDVKWWMPFPKDNWNDLNILKPEENEIALTMGMYGRIFNGKWNNGQFNPFVFDILFWRPMPKLPKGVELKFT